MKRKMLLITLFTLLIINAFADIYKWIDKDGVVHYSDQPSQDIKSERTQIKPATAPDLSDKGELRQRQKLEQTKEELERRIEARRAMAASVRAEREERLAQAQRCLEERKQLSILQMQLPTYRDETGKFRVKWKYDTYQGEREYIDDTTRASEIERVRQKIMTLCQHPDDSEEQCRARIKVIKSEYCAVGRIELEALEKPEARASRQALEEKRQEVDGYCKE